MLKKMLVFYVLYMTVQLNFFLVESESVAKSWNSNMASVPSLDVHWRVREVRKGGFDRDPG